MKSQVELLKHYLATTPKDQIDRDWQAVKGEFGGPTIQEFLSWFPRNLQKRYKLRFKHNEI